MFEYIVWLLPIAIAAALIVMSKAGSPARTFGYIVIAFFVGWHLCSARMSKAVASAKTEAMATISAKVDEAASDADEAAGAKIAEARADARRAISDASDAQAKADMAQAKADLAGSRIAGAEHRADRAEHMARDFEGRLHEYEKKLAARKPNARCTLSGDDARSLRGIAGADTAQRPR